MTDQTDSTDGKSIILIVDDDPQVLEVLRMLFCDEYHVISATSGHQALEIIKTTDGICTAVLDIKMPVMDGVTAGRLIREHDPSIPVIFHTGYPGAYEEDQIDETERPFDYVVKGRSSTRLMRSVRNAVESHKSKRDGRELVADAESTYGMIGRSSLMQEVFQFIRKVSAADNKIVILGETGTGKELVARAIHANSRRRDQKLGILNCNHKTTELVEAELFGYKKGAFTGAHTDRRGLFEVANGGTVFLDEIGDLSSTTQIALLRVLETGEFQQIGPEAEVKKADVRVVCATHRSLDDMVQKGQFRQDLFYRLKGAVITLPPLRQRREDIPTLVERFRNAATIEQGLPYKAFDSEAMNVLIEYDWPGNVRQLKDTVESVIVLTDSELILADDINRYLEKGSTDREYDKTLSGRLRELERTLIIQALAETNFNITAAAQLLDVERSNLSKKIKKYGIDITLLP